MKKFLTTLAILLTSTIGFSATKEEIKKAEIELDNFFNGKYGFNIYENIDEFENSIELWASSNKKKIDFEAPIIASIYNKNLFYIRLFAKNMFSFDRVILLLSSGQTLEINIDFNDLNIDIVGASTDIEINEDNEEFFENLLNSNSLKIRFAYNNGKRNDLTLKKSELKQIQNTFKLFKTIRAYYNLLEENQEQETNDSDN